MAENDLWTDQTFLRDSQYKTDVNLAARASIYAYQHPRIDLQGTVLDLAEHGSSGTVVDYIRSLSDTIYNADPDKLVEKAMAVFPTAPDGTYEITSHCGCLVCEVG